MDDLYQRVVSLEPDAVIIEAGSGRADILEHLAQRRDRYPRPVLLFTETNAPDLMRQAARVGVSAHAVHDLSAEAVRAIIDVAIAQFEEFRGLQRRLASTQSKLEEQKLLERANVC